MTSGHFSNLQLRKHRRHTRTSRSHMCSECVSREVCLLFCLPSVVTQKPPEPAVLANTSISLFAALFFL